MAARHLKFFVTIGLSCALIVCLALIGLAIWIDRQAQHPDLTQAHRALVIARGLHQLTLNDLVRFYGNKTGASAACYQAAVSNYVEDEWNDTAKENGCDSNEHYCSNPSPQSNPLYLPVLFLGDRVARTLVMPLFFIERQIDPTLANTVVTLSNTWVTASHLYLRMYAVWNHLMPKDATHAFFESYDPEVGELKSKSVSDKWLESTLGRLNSNLQKCQSLKPLPWVEGGVPLQETIPGQYTKYAIELGIYGVTMSNLIGSFSAPADRGYIGCLGVLDQARMQKTAETCGADLTCIEAAAQNQTYDLMPALQELKAHHCSLSYAIQMLKPSDQNNMKR